jgi:hypothetical protein
MPLELVIAPEAELDIAEACFWCEGRRSFTKATVAPSYGAFRTPASTSRGGSGAIYAVFDASRDPDRWHRRPPLRRVAEPMTLLLAAPAAVLAPRST